MLHQGSGLPPSHPRGEDWLASLPDSNYQEPEGLGSFQEKGSLFSFDQVFVRVFSVSQCHWLPHSSLWIQTWAYASRRRGRVEHQPRRAAYQPRRRLYRAKSARIRPLVAGEPLYHKGQNRAIYSNWASSRAICKANNKLAHMLMSNDVLGILRSLVHDLGASTDLKSWLLLLQLLTFSQVQLCWQRKTKVLPMIAISMFKNTT